MAGLFSDNELKCAETDNSEPAKPSPLTPEDILHALGHKVRHEAMATSTCSWK